MGVHTAAAAAVATAGPGVVANLRACAQLMTSHVPTMSVMQMVSFLTVAMYPGRNLKQLEELTGFPQSTVSRHMLDLSEYRRTRVGQEGDEKRGRAPGAGLIHVGTSPTSLRENAYTLTSKGKALLAITVTVLQDARKLPKGN